ncbi:hypothetical protein CHARACLAT_016787 [Characodon lateralis]|uniref:Secreted protein n=1 Tax=Characodon lateralis TaxID=208331 RepID=A0ABU7CNX2_9TELE|nr:hypothetical protein [Characodon lateralis]
MMLPLPFLVLFKVMSSISFSTTHSMFAVSSTWPVPFTHGTSDGWRARLTVFLSTGPSTCTVDLCSSFTVTTGLLAVFLVNALLVPHVSLGGQSCLGRCAFMHSSSH